MYVVTLWTLMGVAGVAVCFIGGIFGGTKQAINTANATYYTILQDTLTQDLMGTEESIFTLMAYHEPNVYRRYELEENGLIVKFTQAINEGTVTITERTGTTNLPVSNLEVKEA